MIIYHNPEDWITDVKHIKCAHHKRQPWDTSWPGCTCSTSYVQRLATAEEKAEKKMWADKELERRKKHMADYDAGKIK